MLALTDSYSASKQSTGKVDGWVGKALCNWTTVEFSNKNVEGSYQTCDSEVTEESWNFRIMMETSTTAGTCSSNKRIVETYPDIDCRNLSWYSLTFWG